MTYAKHFSDLELCYACDRLLTDYEEVYCGPCAKHAIDSWDEPSDVELAQRDAIIHRGWTHLAAIIAGAAVGLLVLVAGLTLFANETSAQDALHVTRVIDGVPHEWTLPEAGCQLVKGWEDHSATAWCPSGLLTFDPDGSADREAGVWYVADYTR